MSEHDVCVCVLGGQQVVTVCKAIYMGEACLDCD
jgi:hypothetical protein